MRGWKVVVALLGALLCLASFAPTYALSGISTNPTNVPTGGTVTITINLVALGPDHFSSLTVTDPLGNVFSYSGNFDLTTSSPTISITFPTVTPPDPHTWTLVSGPGGNTGTDVSGKYSVSGTYIDATVVAVAGVVFCVHHMNCQETDSGGFGVPQFNQSILLLVGVMIPALLLVRQKAKSPI